LARRDTKLEALLSIPGDVKYSVVGVAGVGVTGAAGEAGVAGVGVAGVVGEAHPHLQPG